MKSNLTFLKWFQRFRPQTLKQQALLYTLVPTFVLLVGMSVAVFFIVRDVLLNQWGQTAVATLQQTAHLVDMRLHTSKEILQLLQGTAYTQDDRKFFDTVVQKLLGLDSVLEVLIDWPDEGEILRPEHHASMMGEKMGHKFRLDHFMVSSPRFDDNSTAQIVTLVSKFMDENNAPVGQVEVVFSFDSLIDQILAAKWWKSNRAYLLSSTGEVLASASETEEIEHQFPKRDFQSLGSLEHKTLEAINRDLSGTVFGDGAPPREISGFYHLKEAPWTIVVIAPGKIILQPLIYFRNVYIICFAACIAIILLFIIRTTGKFNARIRALSQSVSELASGHFGPPLPEIGKDEVGDLTRNFNRMSAQLKQRLSLKKAISVAREVQQNLLPEQVYETRGLGVAGGSRYCDETGGDYYDLLKLSNNETRIGVAIGDVVGHGIGAALLMTTIRALLRCRLASAGSVSEIMSDVNRLLCLDTTKSGSFITLFYLEIDIAQKSIHWVRAGHEPAIMYFPARNEFVELRGEGLALGVDEQWRFEENSVDLKEEVILCLFTDGVIEVEDAQGDNFGKGRLKDGLRRYAALAPQELLNALLAEIDSFRGRSPQNDDITLVIMKVSDGIQGVSENFRNKTEDVFMSTGAV